MNATMTPEYRKLGLDSSNDMIEHDASRGLGRYPQAALFIRNAGFGRLRMGQIMFDAGDFPQAAADWLSASACFFLASDLERMREALDRARQLDREGKIPSERRDIHEAMKEREAQFKSLDQQLAQFRQEYSRRFGSTQAPSQEALDWLLSQVRELPGFPNLHVLISTRAMRLGQLPLAFAHLRWAETLAPGNPHLDAHKVSLLIVAGERARGVELGREVLAAHPEMHHLRVLLAHALAFQPEASRAQWEEAGALLEPLMKVESADLVGRLEPLALAVTLQHELGHEAEYRRLLDSFNKMADALQPSQQPVIAGLRRALPHVFPQPGVNGPTTPITGRETASMPSGVTLRLLEQLLPPMGAAA